MKDETGKRLKREMERRFRSTPSFPGLTIFPRGIERVVIKEAGRFQGRDYREIMKQIVVILVDLFEEKEPLNVTLSFLSVYTNAKKANSPLGYTQLKQAIIK